MNTAKERILHFLTTENISVRQFELAAGLSNGYMRQLRSMPSQDKLSAIAKAYPNLNIDWVLTGKEGMYNSSAVDKPAYEIPLLDLDASAGFSMVDAVGDNSRRMLSLPKCDGAITIVGKSMEPTIHDGDIGVFDMVNSPSSIRPDGIYIVQYADEEGDMHLTVKRVKRSPEGNTHIRLSADNPEYGYEDVPVKSIARVAKVLYTINRLSY